MFIAPFVRAALLATALSAIGCAGSLPKATTLEAASGEWVSGPIDLRKLTAVVRVAPPPALKSTLETLAAKSDDADMERFFRAHASGGFGSGFVMVHRGAKGQRVFVVTNRHVVEGAADAEVSFQDGTTYKGCEIVLVSTKHDLAVLALPESATHMFGYGFVPRDGELSERVPVIASGFPGVVGTPSYQVTDGKISNAKFSFGEKASDEELVQHTAAIDPGSSGGPLTDESGKLVGVNVMLMRGRASMFFAVPASAVTETVREAHELTTNRTSTAWMKSSLEHTCETLTAELASSTSKVVEISPFISNKLVAEQGLQSYLVVLPTLGPSLRRSFYSEPIGTLRASVVLRLAMRSDGVGGVTGCAHVHPADEAGMTTGKTVRLAMNTAKGPMELGWTFEHGSWRVAGGDLGAQRSK